MSGPALEGIAGGENTVGVTPSSPAPKIANHDDWKDAAWPLSTVIKAYMDHPGVGTLLLGAFLVLKGYVLAKGDIPIALGILENAGLPTVVVGGLLSGLPILVAAMLAAVIYNWLTHRHGEKTRAFKNIPLSPLAMVFGAAIVLSLIVTPWTFMLAAAAVGFLGGMSKRIGKSHRMIVRWLSAVGYLVTWSIAVFAVIVMLYSVWLPHEELTITGVKPSPVGYVLSDNPDGWIIILLSRQHGIVSYRDADVTSRQICERAPYNDLSQLTNAATLWQRITRWRVLAFLHPAVEKPC